MCFCDNKLLHAGGESSIAGEGQGLLVKGNPFSRLLNIRTNLLLTLLLTPPSPHHHFLASPRS